MNKDEQRRVKQLETNQRWLLECTDEICYALCPDFIGTWQQRAEQAVKRAKEIGSTGELKCAECGKPVKLSDIKVVHCGDCQESIGL